MEPKPEKPRYETSFSELWKTNSLFADWMRKVDEKSVKCLYCSSTFTIEWDGEAALIEHLNSATHRKNALEKKNNNLITDYS